MIHLITYSDDSMIRSARLCVESAWKHGVDAARIWTQTDFQQTEFYWANRDILDGPRGCGYWAWKPYVILQALEKANITVLESEFLVYSDAGVEFLDNIRYITDRMTSDIWLFGNQYQHAHWCKRDIVEAIMPLKNPTGSVCYYMMESNGFDRGSCGETVQGASLGCSHCHRPLVDGWLRFDKQCQASVIVIRNSEYSRKFVKEWLDFCTIKHLIDDSPSVAPNHPEFRENRHDQAILTTLAYREGIPLHWWPASYNDGAFTYPKDGCKEESYPILFNHHRGVKTGERAV